MKLRKINKTSRLLLGLAAVLIMGCLVMAVGPAQARYRVENKDTIELQARALEPVYLGRMVKAAEDTDDKVFDYTHQGVWQSVDGTTRLEFAVANGKIAKSVNAQTNKVTSTEVYAKEDQRVWIQLIGDLNVWNGKDAFSLKLKSPSRTKLGAFEEFTAKAERIDPDSQIYKTFGDGWIFTFQDEAGQALSWKLEGGKLSVVELELIMEGKVPENLGLLKLQVTGDYTQK